MKLVSHSRALAVEDPPKKSTRWQVSAAIPTTDSKLLGAKERLYFLVFLRANHGASHVLVLDYLHCSRLPRGKLRKRLWPTLVSPREGSSLVSKSSSSKSARYSRREEIPHRRSLASLPTSSCQRSGDSGFRGHATTYATAFGALYVQFPRA